VAHCAQGFSRRAELIISVEFLPVIKARKAGLEEAREAGPSDQWRYIEVGVHLTRAARLKSVSSRARLAWAPRARRCVMWPSMTSR